MHGRSAFSEMPLTTWQSLYSLERPDLSTLNFSGRLSLHSAACRFLGTAGSDDVHLDSQKWHSVLWKPQLAASWSPCAWTNSADAPPDPGTSYDPAAPGDLDPAIPIGLSTASSRRRCPNAWSPIRHPDSIAFKRAGAAGRFAGRAIPRCSGDFRYVTGTVPSNKNRRCNNRCWRLYVASGRYRYATRYT